MTTLTPAQLAGYARTAGFTGNDVVTAVAVALAESGGHTDSHNTNAGTGDNSYGLWQINMLGALGPARRKEFGIASNDELFDPTTNARCAHVIWKGSGWNAWSTFKRGTYKQFVAQASVAAGSPDTVQTVASVKTVGVDLNPFDVLANVVKAFSSNFFKAAENVIGILVALVLLVLGFVIINRESVKRIAGEVGKVGGDAAKVAAL